MAIPYYLMAFLYLALAGLAALDTALVNLQLLPSLPNLRWLVVHLVTLGALTQFIFGALPGLAAAASRRPRPQFRWPAWITLNTGIVLLLLGIVMMNFPLITLGGTFVFVALALLAWQMVQLRPQKPASGAPIRPEKGMAKDAGSNVCAVSGIKFYMAGLGYLLVGGLVGTGLWQGWSTFLQIAIPKEVHVHANLWGFTALVFAGMLIDLSTAITGQRFAHPRRLSGIFWLMTLGALGLVLGPWLGIDIFQVIGLALHTIGSLLLLVGVLWPVRKTIRAWGPGLWQVFLAYVWFFLAVVAAPLVVAQMGVGNEVAGNGGPLLIFGWILQFSYVVIPLLLRKTIQPDQPHSTGGAWLSLATINTGSLLYAASLFIPTFQGPLRGAAFLLWVVSLLPVLREIVSVFKATQQKMMVKNTDLSG